MNRKFSMLGLAAGAGLVAAFSGCGTTSPSQGSAPTGIAVMALQPQTAPNWFFPLLALPTDNVVNAQVDEMMYHPLLIIGNNDEVDYARSMASSIQANRQGTVYTIHLKPQWHWSNGKSVTAQDVAFTANLMLAASRSTPNLPWNFGGEGSGGVPTVWKSVVAQGTHTVVITLTQPRNPQWFIHNGINQIIPVPVSIWNRYPHNLVKELKFIQSVAKNPAAPEFRVVDGPFRFASMAPNQHWTFTANRHYDGHKSKLAEVQFEYETSSTAEYLGLRSGTISVGYLPPSLYASRTALTKDAIAYAYVVGFNYIAPNFSPKAPDQAAQFFTHLYVRQALQEGINQAQMVTTFFHGHAVLTDTALASQPSTPLFDPGLTKNLYPYNPEQGKKLLESHGWHLVNGVMTKGALALKFTLSYASGSQTAKDIAELIQHGWAQEGASVTLQAQPFDQVVSDMPNNASTWDITDWDTGSAGGWTYGSDPYPTGGSLFASTGGENAGSYRNARMDQLIRATYLPGTSTQILHRMYAYESYVAQQLPGFFIPWNAQSIVYQKNLTGVGNSFQHVGGIFWPNYWTKNGS